MMKAARNSGSPLDLFSSHGLGLAEFVPVPLNRNDDTGCDVLRPFVGGPQLLLQWLRYDCDIDLE
jgi:hypothetical protein